MESLLGSWPYQLWDGVWLLLSEHGEAVEQGPQQLQGSGWAGGYLLFLCIWSQDCLPWGSQ